MRRGPPRSALLHDRPLYSQKTRSITMALDRSGIVALGLVLMLVARYIFRSPFFAIRRESEEVTGSPMAASSG
jgi:hypothetical protein